MLFFLPLVANCQIEKPIKKGNMIIGGTGSIGNQNYAGSETKTFSAYINPTCNYFFVDNLATGLTASIGYTKLEGDKTTSLGIGPNIRYYFNNGFLMRAESLYSKSSGFGTSKVFTFKSGIGYALFINSKVSIEPALLYYFSSQKVSIPDRTFGYIEIPGVETSFKQKTILFEIGFNIFL